MNVLIPLALVGLFVASAPAFAQAETTDADRPDDAAWVEECPPEAMCAFAYGNETCIECSGPVDEPMPYGNETCIECSGPGAGDDGAETCMDGADANETCRDDVQYFGPGGEPDETGAVDDGFTGREGCENCRGEQAGADSDGAAGLKSNDAAGTGALVALGALAATMAVLRRK